MLFVIYSSSQTTGHFRVTPNLCFVLFCQMSGLLQFTVRLTAETEALFTSVERLLHYIDNLKSEAPTIVPDKKPAIDWPTEGSLSMLGVKVRLFFCLKLMTFLSKIFNND